MTEGLGAPDTRDALAAHLDALGVREGTCHLFGAHVEWDRAALQVFSVREGKVVSREGYLLDRVAEPDPFQGAVHGPCNACR